MKIAIIGTGYVGLVTGACFAEMGNRVICADVDRGKIERLKQGVLPIYEQGLAELVAENYKTGDLKFTADIAEAVRQSEICIIAVGTPMCADGSADLQYVMEAAASIGRYMEGHMYIIDKSTVPVGTADEVKAAINEELAKRQVQISFDVISNPEFLKESVAVADCLKPDRVIIGSNNEAAMQVMRELYAPFVRNTERFIGMDVRSAEMTKYAANAMLATKISFMNEISNICERVGADVNQVRMGIGSDSRIGYSFIYPGCGYGGSCFPKDVRALIKTAESCGYELQLLTAVDEVNVRQKHVLVEKIIRKFGEDLTGKVFALWGLAFKPQTDDMREATSIVVAKELTQRGAKIRAYDPKAMENAQQCYLQGLEGIQYVHSKYTALNQVDAMILLTEWKEFRSPDFEEMSRRMKCRIVFDGRNQYNEEKVRKLGFEYYQIGVANRIGSENQ